MSKKKVGKIMCPKKSYCPCVIDPCLESLIIAINRFHGVQTLASCCGHGVYPVTIIVKGYKDNIIIEFFSGTKLEYRKRNRFYKKDQNGYYFIPEVSDKE